MSRIKLGIIGAGDVAREHLKVLSQSKDFEVVGLTSRTRNKAEKLLAEYQWSCFYASLEDMMAKSSPEALMVLVGEESMFEVTRDAMKYHIPLFIEKPAGLTPDLNAQLAQEAQSRNIKTMVGYNRRYYSVFHKGLDIIRQQGPLLGIAIEGHERMWRVRAAGKFSEKVLENWIYANSTHTIDLLRFFGGEINEIHMMARSYQEKSGDQFVLTAHLGQGTLGTYQAHWYSPGGWRVVLYGDGVSVEFKPLEAGRWTDKNFQVHEILPDPEDQNYKPGFYRQLLTFAQLVRGKKVDWPMLDLQGAHVTMVLAQKMLSSVQNSVA